MTGIFRENQSRRCHFLRFLIFCSVWVFPKIVPAACLPEAYAIFCGRLGRTPGFTINESRLSILDWFYVVEKHSSSEKIPEINGKVNQYILNLNADDYVGYMNAKGYSLVYILGMSRIIWAMKQLNDTNGLIRIARLENKAMALTEDAGKEDEWIASAIIFILNLWCAMTALSEGTMLC